MLNCPAKECENSLDQRKETLPPLIHHIESCSPLTRNEFVDFCNDAPCFDWIQNFNEPDLRSPASLSCDDEVQTMSSYVSRCHFECSDSSLASSITCDIESDISKDSPLMIQDVVKQREDIMKGLKLMPMRK